jgi:hypothetical protein
MQNRWSLIIGLNRASTIFVDVLRRCSFIHVGGHRRMISTTEQRKNLRNTSTFENRLSAPSRPIFVAIVQTDALCERSCVLFHRHLA